MLYIMHACLMLFAALSNAVCLHNAFFLSSSLQLIFANAFCFHALSWFIDTYFVYFMYYFASCTVLSICSFFLILPFPEKVQLQKSEDKRTAWRGCDNSMFTPSFFLFNERAMCSLIIAHKSNHYY